MPTPSECKAHIEALLEGYEKLWKDIRSAGKSLKPDFDNWLDHKDYRRVKYTNVIKRIKTLKGYKNNLEQDPPKHVSPEDIEEQDKWYKAHKKRVEEYIEEIQDAKFSKTWYIYHFLSKGKYDKDPVLVRAILSITGDTISSPNGIARFTNIPDGHNYEGQYHKKHDTIFFNLNYETQENTPKKKQLISSAHIRVHFNKLDTDTILLGSYITYEGHSIVRGSVILESITGNEEPLRLSFKENPTIFTAVDPAIKKYLSLKWYNHRTTRNDIHNHILLQEFLDKNTFDKWESRFIELDIPTAFISAPYLVFNSDDRKNNQQTIRDIKIELDKRLNRSDKPKIKIDIEDKQDPIQTDKMFVPVTLQRLQRTRFFILIYTGSEKASFSLVELGWALAHAKVIMIFYEKHSVSKRIETLEAINYSLADNNNKRVHVIPIKNVKSSFNKICNETETIIKENLNDYFSIDKTNKT